MHNYAVTSSETTALDTAHTNTCLHTVCKTSNMDTASPWIIQSRVYSQKISTAWEYTGDLDVKLHAFLTSTLASGSDRLYRIKNQQYSLKRDIGGLLSHSLHGGNDENNFSTSMCMYVWIINFVSYCQIQYVAWSLFHATWIFLNICSFFFPIACLSAIVILSKIM
jgi:hypothetical protein